MYLIAARAAVLLAGLEDGWFMFGLPYGLTVRIKPRTLKYATRSSGGGQMTFNAVPHRRNEGEDPRPAGATLYGIDCMYSSTPSPTIHLAGAELPPLTPS